MWHCLSSESHVWTYIDITCRPLTEKLLAHSQLVPEYSTALYEVIFIHSHLITSL